jgi:hypothetical protein
MAEVDTLIRKVLGLVTIAAEAVRSEREEAPKSFKKNVLCHFFQQRVSHEESVLQAFPGESPTSWRTNDKQIAGDQPRTGGADCGKSERLA